MNGGSALREGGGSPPVLSVRNLSLRFGGSGGALTVLDRINLDVGEGEFLLLAGSNGSGKTLLTRCMTGLLRGQEGEVLFRGRPLSRIRSPGRELGLVFQDPETQILGETVEEDAAFGPENLGLSREETKRRVDAALEAVGLESKRDRPPRRLSGGEKRRLAVAGILAMGCGVIIMDEPFANLDWPGVVRVLETLLSLKRGGKTLVVLTHELEKVLALADRLVILHRGRIRDDGAPPEVLDRLDPVWGVRDPRRNYQNIGDCSWLEPGEAAGRHGA
ncbi:MAG: energy-coupling factor ABC transporter ATP-binding protein [Treponema sp.]|jgi:biotin transport system ATP-binding protein|nr:energy-coupling factor ABC transporter ATP-binding protein [Treponema sp.]